ncbi:metallophosphoesterase [Zhouia amylolytica]|uniref:Outer membrane protein/protective antigen OMA87 n=1 Tax=Zhouia amylolytica AD3 TaxID=1286632 RepID=W2UQN6_9FLAO|nr:metallophosphoesterase [Zhouia amylolytica]ETN96480.1 outer membrane protein/protective antigen OMA87 [Zhouia amylolytica AD3]
MARFLIVLALLILSSCATYKINAEKDSNNHVDHYDEIAHTFYLIGDAGYPKNGKAPEALLAMTERFASASKEDFLIFLGDNIYPDGLPGDDNPERDQAELALKLQTDAAKKFPGSVYFIPGNHDWYSGVKGLKRQEKYVEDALGKDSFLPENGCPIEKVNIDDKTVLLIVDSHWYITNWDRHPTINDECEIKTRDHFLDEFTSEIKKARGKTTLVAIHHPMYSNGPHGGSYSFNDHLKPIPILGTLKNVLRTTTGVVNADMSNRFYNDLRKKLITAAQHNENVIFLSGHEHSLQYIASDNLKQVVSGSGSKSTPVRKRNNQDFGYPAHGYAMMTMYKNGSIDLRFIDGSTNSIVFERQIKESTKASTFDFPQQYQDSVISEVYSKEETSKSKLYKLFWGDRYSKYFSTPVKAKTVLLDTLYGGLKPTRKGGGTQSKSLHFEDSEGKRFVMRAVRKSATQYIQAAVFSDNYLKGQYEHTETQKLIEYVFTGSHPYAPIAIATLSDAAGVYHLNPQLFYVPKQPALGNFNSEFGNELYLLEEHASEGHLHLAEGNFTGDIISTLDVIKEIHSDEDVVIDQTNYIRARLFDMLIGDWDRHHDQWRWMEFKEDGKKVYRPLPRDRDQAFSKMSDGLMLGVGVNLIPAARLLRKYSPDLKDVKGVNMEPYPLDMAFLTDIGKEVWDAQVRFIEENVTDEVIEEAMAFMPSEVQDETVLEIKELLRQRRANLQKIANRYYKLISKYGVITGTNKDDYIEISALDNGNVVVSIFRKKDDTIKDRFHHKEYDPGQTKELWIYGLDDDDTFVVKGKNRHITIRLIGGQNNDDYMVEEGRKIVIYDYKSKKNNLDNATKAKVILTDDYETNVYNYKKLKANTNQIVPLLGANPDDGLKLGFVDTYTTFGFERNPFTSQHRFNAAYYFATNGYELNYTGEFAHVLGEFNLGIKAQFNSPNFTLNFFGFGNETGNPDDELGLDYNRVKTRTFRLMPQLIWNSERGSKVTLGINYESIEVDDTENRFISEINVLPVYLFDEVQYAGVHAQYDFINYDNRAYPTNGIKFHLEAGYKKNLDMNDRGFGYLIPDLVLVQKVEHSGKLVLGTRMKGHFILGDDYEFYQAASIGGTDGLRGYRNQRFTGKNSVYQNTDLRYSFSQVKTALVPVRVGIYGSFDYGRIWLKDDESSKWHNSYGGGFFMNATEMITANLGVFDSSDGMRIAFSLGFGF